MANTSKSKELDQFFTAPHIAAKVAKEYVDFLPKLGYDLSKLFFMEPSAGGGALVDALVNLGFTNYFASDIDVKRNDVHYADFLNDDVSAHLPADKSNFVIFGNPPFGKKSKLALDFVNKCFKYSDTVGFILPLQFRRWLTQKNIDAAAHLVMDLDLPEDSFVYNGKPYKVRCCFQIWSKRDVENVEDLRILSAPKTNHGDFEAAQYNATTEAEALFNESWDLAVLRQGWGDFTKFFEGDEIKSLSKKQQWIFFRAEDDVIERLKKIDFEALASGNTSVKGFGKADVVKEYERLYPHTKAPVQATLFDD